MGVFQCNVFQNNVFQGPCDVAPQRRGGAFYPTPEEIRELLRRQHKDIIEARRLDEATELELRETYDNIIDPPIERFKRRLREIELDDEEAIMHMLIALSDF